MKVSWKLLSQLIDLKNIELNELTQKLTFAGFEVNFIEHKKTIQDTIIDLDITANRTDISCLMGLAREISTIFNIKLKDNTYHNEHKHKLIQNIKNIQAISDIPDIRCSLITNIKNTESPQWLKNYLIAYDIMPSHILADLVYYIEIKWGQHIDVLDINKIDSSNMNTELINISKNKNFDVILKNSNSSKLDSTHLPYIMKYKDKALSVIGIQSNKSMDSNTNTSSILLSSYICDTEYIKQISKILKITTEQSNRQLNNVCRQDFNNAYDDMLQMLIQLTSGKINNNIYKYHESSKQNTLIQIDKGKINSILGPINFKQNLYLSVEEILSLLKQLHFKPNYLNSIFYVTIPEYRQNDITRPIDVIEEIVRIYGFQKFVGYLPAYTVHKTSNTFNLFIKQIRKILRHIGLHEVLHYSLDKTKNSKNNTINLYNPLQEDQSQLRNSLLHGLLNTKQYNTKQKNSSTEIFEIGKTFQKNITKYGLIQVHELIHLAGILGNYNSSKNEWIDKPQNLSWFQAKGQLEDIFEKLHINIHWQKSINNINKYNLLHPKRTAIIYHNTTQIGIFGQLNLRLAHQLDINEYTYLFEINLYHLFNSISRVSHLESIIKPYSTYPSVTRDISIVLTQKETVQEIQNTILANSSVYIESIEIFNEYQHNTINNFERIISFRITYRLDNRTLNNKDIENIDKDIHQLLYK